MSACVTADIDRYTGTYISVLDDVVLIWSLCCIVTYILHIGSSEVDLASSYQYVVPCITDWEDLGVHLKLKPYHLDCISRDNEYTPNRTKNCCRAVLKKWLELDCSPTWGKLEDAVNAIQTPPTTDNNIAGTVNF